MMYIMIGALFVNIQSKISSSKLIILIFIGIIICFCCCFTYRECNFELNALEYPYKEFRDSKDATYLKTSPENATVVLTKFPYRIDVFYDKVVSSNGMELYTQEDGIVAIQVCNHTYHNRLFLVFLPPALLPVEKSTSISNAFIVPPCLVSAISTPYK